MQRMAEGFFQVFQQWDAVGMSRSKTGALPPSIPVPFRGHPESIRVAVETRVHAGCTLSHAYRIVQAYNMHMAYMHTLMVFVHSLI